MVETRPADWRTLAEAAHREQDPARLMDLISRLRQALEERAHLSRAAQAENWGCSAAGLD